MLLKSLELQGFKTFPDKTTLTFEEGVTSVVGPNGSGKSNISDAMRWVLGEQALRVLRCAKMEDVVFSGTPQRKAKGYAEVTLNIDNTDRKLPFENDIVAITRRYYRSGESEYLINKTMVRLKDINELFMDTGLGRDGYSIIGQGKIDSIVAAKSEERREIFEEASGISRYRYRKEESERRLHRAEENLVRLRDIFSELEERVEPLRVQAEKAEAFIAYDGEKKELEIGIWVETLNQSSRILRQHNEKIEVVQAQKEALVQELADLTANMENNAQETNAATARMEQLRGEAAQLEEQALRADGEISVLENDGVHHGQSMERIQAQIEMAAVSEQDIEREIETQRGNEQAAEAEVAAHRKRMDAFNTHLDELRQNADAATREIEGAAVDLARVNAALSEQQIAKSSAESSMAEIQLRAGAVSESIAQNQEKQRALQEEEKDLQGMLAETEEGIGSRENAIKGYEIRLEGRQKKAEEARKLSESLHLDANEQTRRAKLLSDLERNLEGFAQSVKAVMKESRRGTLQGIYGPVAGILKVPGTYAVALETALGAAMQNVVVESEGNAKSAIAFLKKADAGRATFLPRTTIKGRRIDLKDVAGQPGFVGLAADLCNCEARFDEIKDSLLGRVAVAETLDSAAAIAKRAGYRFRVVSLDGQVVNAGGSFTGGAKARNSGLLSRASEIERITAKAAALREKAEEAQAAFLQRQNDVAACDAALQTERAELSVLQEERIKISAEHARVLRDVENALQEGKDLQEEALDAQGRTKQLVEKAQLAEEGIVRLQAALEQAEIRTAQLTEQRDLATEKSDAIGKELQEIRMAEFTAQKNKEMALSSIAELTERKRDSAGMVQRLEEELKTLSDLRANLKEQIACKKESAAALRTQAAQQREKSAALRSARDALEQQAGVLRTTERELTGQRERVGQELARLQERSEGFQREYDDITAKLWEEYELTRREAEELGTQIQDISKAQRRLAELKRKIKELGAVNVGAVVEYQEVHERYQFLKTQIGDVEQSKEELLKLIGELTRQMREQFIKRFAEINKNFGLIFKELFGGGSAELSFADETDVLHSGIEITVQPPGKIVKHIESLSGGEKALVAISIYFAIMKVNPPPFCVLDEIEAALDDVNVNRFAQYLRRMSDHSQFIVITHRRGTMEGSDMLYGVTMQDEGISKLLALKTHEEAASLTNGTG